MPAWAWQAAERIAADLRRSRHRPSATLRRHASFVASAPASVDTTGTRAPQPFLRATSSLMMKDGSHNDYAARPPGPRCGVGLRAKQRSAGAGMATEERCGAGIHAGSATRGMHHSGCGPRRRSAPPPHMHIAEKTRPLEHS